MTTFGSFELTWFWGVDEDRKIKEYDFLYKYPPSRLSTWNASSLLYKVLLKHLSA